MNIINIKGYKDISVTNQDLFFENKNVLLEQITCKKEQNIITLNVLIGIIHRKRFVLLELYFFIFIITVLFMIFPI